VKLGILGGSFNPVHIGHLFLADTILEKLKLDRIVFVPAYRSPFKLDANENEASANDRLDMLAASIAGDNRYAIDACEINRGGVSYTINTLEDIIARYLPEGKPVFIIGDDLAPDFYKWRESERILELADIAVACRINSANEKYQFNHIVVKNEVISISSQDLRKKIREGGSWRSFLPFGASAIIEDRKLYGYQSIETCCTQDDIRRVEAAAHKALSIERFLHSRNTALHASDMCRRFGIDPMAGYLAGIAHDLAKQLDNKQLLKIIKNNPDFTVSDLEKEKPNLLHGKAAAVLLRERFCIHNKDVLEAVAFHTSGKENMGPLAKIIYIADKTESSRNIDSALRIMCREDDLDGILFAVLEKTITKLKAKELDLSDDTLMLLEKIKQRRNN
jgi:nicotinate-nucleotide adenylyltransferase